MKASAKHTIRHALLRTLPLLPAGAIGGWFTGVYLYWDLYSAELRQMILDQLGSPLQFYLTAAIQYLVYTAVLGFFGWILAGKIGLDRPFRPEKTPMLRSLALGIGCGLLLTLDLPVFGRLIPGLADTYAQAPSAANFASSLLVGGVVEEVMLRLFCMSLIALLLGKLCRRGQDQPSLPTGVLVAANVVSALLFAAGHLPGTVSAFGALTPMLLLRCFLFNGLFGLAFGRLYRKFGIGYAMICHASVHATAKLIWLIFF